MPYAWHALTSSGVRSVGDARAGCSGDADTGAGCGGAVAWFEQYAASAMPSPATTIPAATSAPLSFWFSAIPSRLSGWSDDDPIGAELLETYAPAVSRGENVATVL